MTTPSHNELLLSVTVGSIIAALYESHLPPIYETRLERVDNDFRMAQAQVTGTSFLLAGATALLARSWWPVWGAAAVTGVLLSQYELAARANVNRGS